MWFIQREPFHEDERAPVFWWSPPAVRVCRCLKLGRENVGDHLGPLIAGRMLDKRGLRIADKPEDGRRLLSVGSVLHFARDGDVLWGTGYNGKIAEGKHRFRSLDVRAVRGPITRQFLASRDIACPEIYGDPGLLFPRLFPELAGPARKRSDRGVVLVPHLHDPAPRRGRWRILRPTTPWRRFARAIQRAELVVSTSLHGIILADAFGVPARWLRASRTESDHKYHDYFLGTGRSGVTHASSVEEAISMGGHEPPRFDADALMEAFPYDLWTSGAFR